MRPCLPPRAPSASFDPAIQRLAQTINPTLAPFFPLYTLYCFESPDGEKRAAKVPYE